MWGEKLGISYVKHQLVVEKGMCSVMNDLKWQTISLIKKEPRLLLVMILYIWKIIIASRHIEFGLAINMVEL